jgi:lactate 2-monooxygenase
MAGVSGIFSSYQGKLLRDAAAGSPPPGPCDGTELEGAAARVLAPGPFGYVAGGAGSGDTVRANRAAFACYRLVPRMLRKAGPPELRTSLLGKEMAAPVLLAPIGVQSIVHPDGELAVARAAAEVGVTMIVASPSSYSLEEVAAANGDGDRWYQLYWPDDPEVCLSILDRAKRAGFSALVVTVDTPRFGWRPNDLDQGFAPALRGIGAATAFSDPVFRARLARPPEQDLPAAVRLWQQMFTGADHGWDDLAFLRANWSGPLLVKGILHADDARAARDAGADGVVVSNHGGRQVDGAIAALDALPSVSEAVGDELAVLLDSGIRTGSDVLKALALGADAVAVGRPYLYGLALNGHPGVLHVLRSILADAEVTLGMLGAKTVHDLGEHHLHKIGW